MYVFKIIVTLESWSIYLKTYILFLFSEEKPKEKKKQSSKLQTRRSYAFKNLRGYRPRMRPPIRPSMHLSIAVYCT